MKAPRPLIATAFALLLHTALAAAERTHPCANTVDDAARLACYDAQFGKPAAAVGEPEKVRQEFGFTREQVARNSPSEARAVEPDRISGVVTAIETGRDGKFFVTLDNGQKWSQSEIESQVLIEKGDTVTVKRGLLGSYLLVSAQGIATRVKRVK
jgi:hypothetical protein